MRRRVSEASNAVAIAVDGDVQGAVSFRVTVYPSADWAVPIDETNGFTGLKGTAADLQGQKRAGGIIRFEFDPLG